MSGRILKEETDNEHVDKLQTGMSAASAGGFYDLSDHGGQPNECAERSELKPGMGCRGKAGPIKAACHRYHH